MALERDPERKRFVDAISGAAGLGLIFKTEDLLPAGAAKKILFSHTLF